MDQNQKLANLQGPTRYFSLELLWVLGVCDLEVGVWRVIIDW